MEVTSPLQKVVTFLQSLAFIFILILRVTGKLTKLIEEVQGDIRRKLN